MGQAFFKTRFIAWTGGGNDRKMKGNDYLQQFALPNFFFFVTTAYNILRHRGVPLGKRDFLGLVSACGLPRPSSKVGCSICATRSRKRMNWRPEFSTFRFTG
jgi:hypothetical protein